MRIMAAVTLLVFSLSTSADDLKTPDDADKTNSIFPQIIVDAYAYIKNLRSRENKNSESNENSELDKLPLGNTDPRIFNAAAGTRHNGGVAPLIATLTPQHTGSTLKKQPTLYWFTSQLIQEKPKGETLDQEGEPLDLEFVLNSEESTSPVLRVPIVVSKYGFQSIKLSDYGVSLKPEIRYTWFVSVVPDHQKRSHDMTIMGSIRRINPTESLINELSQSPDDKIALIYAKHDIWYDMMASLNDLIIQNPTDTQLTDTRAQLLELEDLAEVACYNGSNYECNSAVP